MAIDVSTAQDVLIGVKEQTTFGTAMISSTAFELIKCDLPTIVPDVKMIKDKHSKASRYGDTSDVIVHEKGALPVFSLPNTLIRKKDLAQFLYAFFQSVTEGLVGTGYSKAFTWPTSSQPDFTNAEGFFMTVAQSNPGTTDDYVVADCICKGLNFSIASGGENNILKMSADMIGRGSVAATENLSGTWTLAAESLFYLEDITAVTFNHSSAITPVVRKLDVKLTQDVVGIGQDSGQYQTYKIDNQAGKVTGSLFWEAPTADLMGYWRAGTVGEWNITWGTADTDGYLGMTFYGLLDSVATAVDDGLMIDFSLDLLGNSASSKVPATIVLADAQSKGW